MRTWNEAQDSRPRACLAGWSIQPFLLFQEQEDPNKLATSWPDYYIDRINSMAAVSLRLSCPGPTWKGCGGGVSLMFPCSPHPGISSFPAIPKIVS